MRLNAAVWGPDPDPKDTYPAREDTHRRAQAAGKSLAKAEREAAKQDRRKK